MVFAGWLRYLMAIDDAGNAFTPSSDPLLTYAQEFVKDFKLGQNITAAEVLKAVKPLLSNEKIFGVDLVKLGMAELVCGYFVKLISVIGAVRNCFYVVERNIL